MMKTIINYLFTFIIVILLQAYFPVITISGNPIKPDFFLLLLTYIAIIKGRFVAIIIGLSLGLLQDFITQSELLGFFAFTKSILGYLLGSLFEYKTIWRNNTKMLFIIFVYLIQYIIYIYIFNSGIDLLFFIEMKLVLINLVVNISFLWFINKYMFNSKLI
jgi:rod shape-determining protein MreD